MKNKIMIMAAIVAVLALAVTALAVTDDSDAAVDDTFTSGVYTCKILTETSSGGTVEISSNTASGSISIPSTVTSGGKTYNVTEIGYKAFENRTSLTSVTIPVGVTSISNDAFKGCTSLTSVTLPEGIGQLYSAFDGCTSLTSLTIYGTPRVGGSNSIGSCSNLVTLNMPAAIATYGDPLIATSWVGIHTITWADGSESGRQSYVMGTPVYLWGTPGKTGHAFEGWQPALAPVTGDVTYTARFSAGTPTGETSHTITWIVGDTVTTTKCVTGSTPSYGANPIKAGSRFSGWSPTLMPATANAIYRAVFVPSDTPIPDPSVDRDGVADYVPYISLAAAVILTLIILIFYHPVLVIVDLALYVITAAGFMGWI